MENKNEDFQDFSGIHPTLGEILPGGAIIEFVHSRSGRGGELVRWETESYEIRPQFQEGETIYTAGYLHPSVLEATRFAREPADTGMPGSYFGRSSIFSATTRDYCASTRYSWYRLLSPMVPPIAARVPSPSVSVGSTWTKS